MLLCFLSQTELGTREPRTS